MGEIKVPLPDRGAQADAPDGAPVPEPLFLIIGAGKDAVRFQVESNPDSLQWALMEFAASGDSDVSVTRQTAAIHTFLRQVIIADDWGRFTAWARVNRPTAEYLMQQVVNPVLEALSGPPVRSSVDDGGGGSVSSASPVSLPTAGPSSKADSSSEDFARSIR